jgi:hypothetical protein
MFKTPVSNVEAAQDGSDSVIQKNVKKKWQSYIWDTFDKSPEERRFLFKLDTALLTFASLGNLVHSQNDSLL